MTTPPMCGKPVQTCQLPPGHDGDCLFGFPAGIVRALGFSSGPEMEAACAQVLGGGE